MLDLGVTLLTAGALGAALPLAIYPAIMAVLGFGRDETHAHSGREGDLPTISVIVVVRDGAKLLPAKIASLNALEYPKDKLDFVFFSDGSTDATVSILRAWGRARVLEAEGHVGKAAGLNRAAAAATGDILVFSDADAVLAPDVLHHLIPPFADARVGGVCGQRRIREDGNALTGGQQAYIRWDSRIKMGESRLGFLTSNDGKLYAIRRPLFTTVPAHVTDDLHQALAVLGQGRRFAFTGQAVAFIPRPSGDKVHEVSRRRRIVTRSLANLAEHRSLLNPLRHGALAGSLFINKGLRRAVPLFLIVIFVACGVLAVDHPAFLGLFAAQAAGWCVAAVAPRVAGALPRRLGKLLNTVHYIAVGMVGTALGVVDFARGRRVSRWNPIKETR